MRLKLITRSQGVRNESITHKEKERGIEREGEGERNTPFIVPITQNNRTSISALLLLAHPDPPDTVHMIPVIPQLTIRVQLARTNEVIELRDGVLGVLTRRTVEIAVENAAENRSINVCDRIQEGIAYG